MLGLPSTTEVNVRIPKEAFYSHLKMSPAIRRSLVDDIDRFVVRNSLKSSTVQFLPGESVFEIMVVEVVLKRRRVPRDALRAVAAANKHKLLFVCTYGEECILAVLLKDLFISDWQPVANAVLKINPESMDTAWDSLASQVIYRDEGGKSETVEERFANDAKLASMKEELAKLEMRCKKEKQFVKKNELFEQAGKLKSEIAAFEEGR